MTKQFCDRCGGESQKFNAVSIRDLDHFGQVNEICKKCEGDLKFFMIGKEEFCKKLWKEIEEEFNRKGLASFFVWSVIGLIAGSVAGFLSMHA